MEKMSVEEIKAEISRLHQTWSKLNIDKILETPSFYVEKHSTEFRLPHIGYYATKKCSNPLMDLGLRVYYYHKNAKRCFGNSVDILFDDANIAHDWNNVEKAFRKAHALGQGEEYNKALECLATALHILHKTVYHRAKFDLEKQKDKEWVCGSADGRRLGIVEILERIENC